MPKRPGKPAVNLTPFSIASQVTGPPFAHSLDKAELRQQLTQVMGRRDLLKDATLSAGPPEGELSVPAAIAAKRRKKAKG